MWKPWRIFVLSFALSFILLLLAKSAFDAYFLTVNISGEPNYGCQTCTTIPPDYFMEKK